MVKESTHTKWDIIAVNSHISGAKEQEELYCSIVSFVCDQFKIGSLNSTEMYMIERCKVKILAVRLNDRLWEGLLF